MRANGWRNSPRSEGLALPPFSPLSTGAQGSAGGQELDWTPLGRGVPEDSQSLSWLPHGTDGRCLPGSCCLPPRSPLVRAGPWRRVRAAALRSKLNNLRLFGRLTRDLFSRAGRASARKSLIFLDPVSAASAATSDNGQCVNFAYAPEASWAARMKCVNSARPVSSPA